MVHDDEVIEVAAHPVPKVVDTTGAGDLYAAGFLYGLTNGRSLEACGRLGSVAASAVLGHTGPRPGSPSPRRRRASGSSAPAGASALEPGDHEGEGEAEHGEHAHRPAGVLVGLRHHRRGQHRRAPRRPRRPG